MRMFLINKIHYYISLWKSEGVDNSTIFIFQCSVALPHGTVGWSAVCNCGILE